MADEQRDPHDDKVRSVPLPGEGPDEVVAQENMSPQVGRGGGEWPSPAADPTGAAPGTAGDGPGRRRRATGEAVEGPPPGSASQPDLKQDATEGGDRGPARTGEAAPSAGHGAGEFPAMKDVLAVDPVAGGSRSAPADEDG